MILLTQRQILFALAAILSVAVAAPQLTRADDDAEKPADSEQAKHKTEVEKLVDQLNKLRKQRVTSLAEYNKRNAELGKIAANILKAEKDTSSEAYRMASFYALQGVASEIGAAKADTEKKRLLQKAIDLVKSKGKPESLDARSASTIARALERSGAKDLAKEAYNGFADLFANSDDATLKRYAEMFRGSVRRMELVGNEMKLTGTTFEGEAFDLSSLKGKVVLVDFWATWCPPCRAEYPGMKANYEKYHDQGFEIVGVSLDRDRKALEKYITDKKVPWITLHEKEAGGRHPAAARYGITGIPTMILIGRDGKVVSLRARGSELTRLLEEAFKDSKGDAKKG